MYIKIKNFYYYKIKENKMPQNNHNNLPANQNINLIDLGFACIAFLLGNQTVVEAYAYLSKEIEHRLFLCFSLIGLLNQDRAANNANALFFTLAFSFEINNFSASLGY